METLLAKLANCDGVLSAEQLLTEERLRLATEAADIGWWDVEEGHGRLSWPPRVKAMFGISPDVPVSMDDFYSGLHPEDRDGVAAAYAGATDPARRALYDVEYRTIGKEDGVIRWVAAKGRGVFDESGRCERVIGTAMDITERKLAQEERLAREQQDAELREQFIAVLGHDLRNPLAAVAGGIRLMVLRPERSAEIGEHMEQCISRMFALIENTLDFARGRLGGGFVTTRDSEKPLQPVLLQIIEELRAVHPEREVAVIGAGSVEALVGRTDFDFYPPEIARRFRDDELAFMARGETTIIEQASRDPDGRPTILCSLKTPLRDAEDEVVGHVGHGRDITSLRQAEAAALHARATLESVAELFGDGVAVFDAENRLQLCNAAFAHPYGALPAELIGLGLEAIMRRPAFRNHFRLDEPSLEELIEAKLRAYRDDNAEPVELYFGATCFLIRKQRLADGSTIIARTDITHLKIAEAELRRLATTDPLTGVANRRHLIEQAERAIARCRHDGRPVALLLADLDRFKRINDRHGHAVGDRALQDFARIATAALRPGDLLARWGGEEFVVLLPGADQAAAVAIAERLRDAVASHAPLIDGGSLKMTVSLGVAALAGSALGFDELASLADRALYRAKANGRNRVELADQACPALQNTLGTALH